MNSSLLFWIQKGEFILTLHYRKTVSIYMHHTSVCLCICVCIVYFIYEDGLKRLKGYNKYCKKIFSTTQLKMFWNHIVLKQFKNWVLFPLPFCFHNPPLFQIVEYLYLGMIQLFWKKCSEFWSLANWALNLLNSNPFTPLLSYNQNNLLG